MRIRLIILFFLYSALVSAQDSDGKVLDYDTYIEIVKSQHPMARQADLQVSKADAKQQSARGAFDPKVEADIKQKYFDGTEYYDLSGGALKIPTWFGVELETGYEQNQGQYLNPENRVPNAGLWNAGISIPIGQGLFIDERRASLRQAQIYRNSSEVIRLSMLNDLILKAGKAYWDWYLAYNQVKIYEEALRLAEQRFSAVKLSTQLGDAPDIDTLESGIQVQSRMLLLQEAQLNFANQSARLSLYLWSEGFIPLELAENTHPMLGGNTEAFALELDQEYVIDSLVNQHPELMKYNYQLEILEIERRWKAEQLKPELRLKYNPIAEPLNNDPFSQYSINNYTWGLHFKFPIFLRKERGNLNFVKLQLNETQLDTDLKRQSLKNEAQIAINEWKTTINQVSLFTRTTEDYLGLLQGEQQLFDGGESSLFMVNSRELGYINARIKLVELIAKNHKAKIATYHALGQLVTQ